MGAVLQGFFLGLSLILAIGAQNAFVLRQGLRRQFVFAVCLTCALSDAILIVLGVSSFSAIEQLLPWVTPVMRYGGAAFLIWYGVQNALQAYRGGAALNTSGDNAHELRKVLLTVLALTWLNPHVYLDTVVLLGSISTQYTPSHMFGAGAVLASFTFFFALGYGARFLSPIFARPAAWRILDGLIALTMWAIAAKLIFFL